MSVLKLQTQISGDIMTEKIKITEMFLSLQGEGEHSGLPCFFIRTSGCDLRCSYCDTEYAFTEGVKITIDEIIQAIPDHIHLIQITGGEPLLQEKGVILLMERIRETGELCKILLETGGHRSLSNVPPYVHIVMDIKLPGSGEESCVLESNLAVLKKTDEIKFVITDRHDFESAVKWIGEHGLTGICRVLFSPAAGSLDAALLADWILQEKLDVRLMLQLHKIIWGEKRGV